MLPTPVPVRVRTAYGKPRDAVRTYRRRYLRPGIAAGPRQTRTVALFRL